MKKITALIIALIMMIGIMPANAVGYWRAPTSFYEFNFVDDKIPDIDYISGSWSRETIENELVKNIDFDNGKTGGMTPVSGEWVVKDGRYVQESEGNIAARSNLEGKYSNFDLTFDYMPISANSYAIAYIGNSTVEMGNSIGKMKRNGKEDYFGGSNPEVGKTKKIRLILLNGTLSVYFEDKNEPAYTLSGWENGEYTLGLGTWASSVSFDNVVLSKQPPIASRRNQFQSGKEEALALFGDSEKLNSLYEVTAATTGFGGGEIGMAMRADKNGDGVYCTMNGTEVFIKEKTGGRIKTLAEKKHTAFGNKYYVISVLAVDNTVTLYIDQEEILSAETSVSKAGKWGFYTNGTSAYYDYVKVSFVEDSVTNLTAAEDTTYYVSSTDGDDSNDGLSPQTAWRSITKVNAVEFRPGDKLLFKCGDVFEGRLRLEESDSGTEEKPFTVSSYGEGNKPTFRDPSTCLLVNRTSNIHINGLRFESARSGSINNKLNTKDGNTVEFVYGDNEEGTKVYKNIYIENNEIVGPGATTQTSGMMIIAGGKKEGVVENLYYTGNYMSDVGYYGLYTHGPYFYGLFDNVVIEYNVFERVGYTALMLSNAKNSSVKRNIIKHSGAAEEPAPRWLGGGMYPIAVKDSVIAFNEVIDASGGQKNQDAMGIDIDWMTDNIICEYNYIENSHGSGINTMATKNLTIRNNYLKRNRQLSANAPGAIALGDFGYDQTTSGCVIEDNVILMDNEDNGKAAIATYRAGGDAGKWSDNVIKDNTVVIPNDRPNEQVYIFDKDTGVTSVSGTKVYSDVPFKATYVKDSYDLDKWQKEFGFDKDIQYLKYSDEKPAEVKDVKVTKNTEDKVSLAWTAVPGAAHYNIYRGTTPDFEVRYINMVGESKTTDFTDTEKRKENTTYYYKVQAESPCGVFGTPSSDTVTVVSKGKTDFTGHWAESALKYVQDKGVYVPSDVDSEITREEFCDMLARSFDFEIEKYNGIYSDVSTDDEYADVIQTTHNHTLIPAFMITGRSFKPKQALKRQELAAGADSVYVVKHGCTEYDDNTSFNDMSKAEPEAVRFIKLAYSLGLMKGDSDNEFRPADSASWAEAAVVIYRLSDMK